MRRSAGRSKAALWRNINCHRRLHNHRPADSKQVAEIQEKMSLGAFVCRDMSFRNRAHIGGEGRHPQTCLSRISKTGNFCELRALKSPEKPLLRNIRALQFIFPANLKRKFTAGSAIVEAGAKDCVCRNRDSFRPDIAQQLKRPRNFRRPVHSRPYYIWWHVARFLRAGSKTRQAYS